MQLQKVCDYGNNHILIYRGKCIVSMSLEINYYTFDMKFMQFDDTFDVKFWLELHKQIIDCSADNMHLQANFSGAEAKLSNFILSCTYPGHGVVQISKCILHTVCIYTILILHSE